MPTRLRFHVPSGRHAGRGARRGHRSLFPLSPRERVGVRARVRAPHPVLPDLIRYPGDGRGHRRLRPGHPTVGTGFPRYDEVCGESMRGWPGAASFGRARAPPRAPTSQRPNMVPAGAGPGIHTPTPRSPHRGYRVSPVRRGVRQIEVVCAPLGCHSERAYLSCDARFIVIPSAAEESEPVVDTSGPFVRPSPAFGPSAHGRRGS